MPRPRLRGSSHLLAAALAMPLAVLWVLTVPAGQPRLAVAAFAFGIATMFTCSALLHLQRWNPATYERLFRLDHTGIYLAIGGTGIALALLGLNGWASTTLLVCSLAGMAFGIAVEWLPFAPPKGFNSAIYLTFGWVPVALLPWLWMANGWLIVLLLMAGGLVYTVGATVVGLRRPNLVPGWFGYHELFHLFVIFAVAIHAWMIAELISRTT